MPNKMERFTQRARHVLSLAQEEAERLQHSYIGPEHLLIGLVREEDGIAGRALRGQGFDPAEMRELVDRLTRFPPLDSSSRLDLTPEAKKVLELAVAEAQSLNHPYIGTEHLLLGLLRQTEGIAIEVLRQHNVSAEEVRREVLRLLKESPALQTAEDTGAQFTDPSEASLQQ